MIGTKISLSVLYPFKGKREIMKVTLNHLIELCKGNENYTAFMGRDLGIEEQHEDSGLYKFLLN